MHYIKVYCCSSIAAYPLVFESRKDAQRLLVMLCTETGGVQSEAILHGSG